MIKIDFNEPKNIVWKFWRIKCIIKNKSTIKDALKGKSIKITNLYKKQNDVYLGLDGAFHGKCVYCETLIDASHPGDIDHFRPKKKVTDSNNVEIMITDSSGKKNPHPGYYWLVYDWLNLLPSCEDCNRPSSRKTIETIGKRNKFPVESFRATKPGEETDEIPLLIQPVLENPAQHLDIDSTGLLIGLTDKGDMTIEIFALNKRVSLVQGRRDSYRDVKDKVRNLLMSFLGMMEDTTPSGKKWRLAELQDISSGKKPYSIAAIKGLMETEPQFVNVMTGVNEMKPIYRHGDQKE